MVGIESRQEIAKDRIEYLDHLVERLEDQRKMFVDYINKAKIAETGIIKICIDFFKYNTKNLSSYKKQLDKWQREDLKNGHKNLFKQCIEKIIHAKTLNQKLLQLSNILKKTAIKRRPIIKADIEMGLKLFFPSDSLPSLDRKTLKALYMYVVATRLFGTKIFETEE